MENTSFKSKSVPIEQLVQDLINVSEKAANIARTCRAEEELFALLIEEKKDDKKNQRFAQDFKTLADVLVQETIAHDLSKKYQGIGSHIYGEENNCFTNTLGETISIKIDESEDKTAAILSIILDGNMTAASLLASAVYSDVKMETDFTKICKIVELPLNIVGIWIDPIDSTSEYIHGIGEEPNSHGLVASGLQCVCVLIGVYNLETGSPILGIVNQPFSTWDSVCNRWLGQHFWGMSWNGISASSLNQIDTEEIGKVVMSSSEDEGLVTLLQKKYDVMFVAGAGYKLLAVYLGLADFYILSKGSTYRWDVCGPHSLLLSIGGGIISYQQALQCPTNNLIESLNKLQLSYNTHEPDSKGVDCWCNKSGIIAYRNPQALIKLIDYITTCTR